ncbi:hypothetical protein F8388_020608 [Cannabis sativa]|uniref:Major facilitator superfamily (MFS) profile domain-containing protein n=1 Tax=Cannabis sativa TaxID=3483 RepID=A0A7J6F2F4_CANSA|nr:hypothetical protein F8388_020608 [Cannabis sativa]
MVRSNKTAEESSSEPNLNLKAKANNTQHGFIGEIAPEETSNKPPGIKFVEHIKKSPISFKTHQVIVLIVTFLAYASYHAARKTTSVVKSSLDPQSQDLGLKFAPWRITYLQSPPETRKLSWAPEDGWAPFSGSDGTALLGELDVAFLAVYAMGMYFSGHLGDRLDLRIFLTVGMVGTGVFTSLFGLGYWGNIHSFYYFLIIQMAAGLFQSTGWPSVVAVVGKWFGKKKRGLIMGIWNAHTSIGNITGSLVASVLLSYGWGWSFVVPGVLITFFGLVVFFFLPVSPEAVGADEDEDEPQSPKKIGEALEVPLLRSEKMGNKDKAVGFIEAWKFQELLLLLFAYSLPNWSLTHFSIGFLSTLATQKLWTCVITSKHFLYVHNGNVCEWAICSITTAVSADLGTHSSLKGNSRALATVTAIIDGTGSVGAAIGPLLTGYISTKSWSLVFTMLMGAALIAGLFLTRLVVCEVTEKIEESRSQGGSPATRSSSPIDERVLYNKEHT